MLRFYRWPTLVSVCFVFLLNSNKTILEFAFEFFLNPSINKSKNPGGTLISLVSSSKHKEIPRIQEHCVIMKNK